MGTSCLIKRNNVTDKDIFDVLKNVGMPCSILGYKYVKCAINLVLENEDIIFNITTQLYPKIAEIYSIDNWKRVERAIRTAVTKTFQYGANYEVFGMAYNPETGIPTNAQFIATICEYLKAKE